MSLFRVWYDDSNDRDEIARFKADDFDEVQEYLLKNFIKEDQQEKVEETDFGLEWNQFEPDECIEQHKADKDCDACIFGPHHGLRCKDSNLECEAFEYDEDYNPCDMCDGCSAGFEIEEVEEPTEDEFEFKTIQGTNDYYDLTKPEGQEKAPDWDKTLSGAWKKSPEHGIAALLLNPITPQEALSNELKEKSKKLLEELK